MKLCFISCQYPPLSRTLRRYKFVRYLADGGMDVQVVAHGNITQALGTFVEDPTLTEPAREFIVHRPRSVPWHLAGELLYRTGMVPCPYVNWLQAATRVAAQVASTPRDVVMGVYPPLTNLLAAAAVARRTGARLVVDLRDEYLGLSRGLRRPWARHYEPRLVRQAALVSTATDHVAQTLQERYGLMPDRLHVTLNGYWDEVSGVDVYPQRETLHVVYAGAISPAQGLDTLCAAVEHLRTMHPRDARRLTVTVYGPQTPHLRHLLPRLRAAAVAYGGFLPAERVSAVLRRADACFVSLSSAQYAYAVPGKLYEIIAHARPIIAALPRGPARRIVEEERFGLTVDCQQPQALAAAVRRMMETSLRHRFHMNLLRQRHRFAARPHFLSLARRIRALP